MLSMTQDLFRQDAYLPECSAIVTAVTPIGGVCFIAGWVCLALAAAKLR